MTNWHLQTAHPTRFDWGPTGATRLAPAVHALVVVDVLSFTTSVTVAVDAGTRVYPYPWHDDTATAYAEQHAADLAVGRRQATPDSPWSLSPAALRTAPFTPRLVLPSPNGSAISAAADRNTPVIAASLRNATAVGNWLAAHGYGTPDHPVAVIAAGERWPDDSLRPALEDLLGAGAVIDTLRRQTGGATLSPEAATAATAFRHTEDIKAALTACASGRELIEGGFPEDVTVAAEFDASPTVPVLTNGEAFTPAG
ncbi:phosphosulfolactate phosphohydrolase-like enzyme [Streptomyces lincolnensis]|uniref:Probable 2-phosphosulfolactate phosphatase n=1 Tax=Streptomyces lincolnensis TaxID=1915 RepID=A0A1B1MFL5_STRLN|nr:2-phosphosulfolactate phosphatase [Streptomyces lincolnensis]ANS67303.1 phosphosulfolactate phosphohydrolase-like enzyme [Streptomyces lincolnensis]AXG56174.1 phosphosulfolactate phosphohydrolase-like enzyme [Streptomyces lincolnensis]QMV07362.1 hypothetical protein GJU35_17900 [Streptomyces lincolnensis]